MMDSFLAFLIADLNPEQREALMHEHARSGPLLVLAGAGTGKTTVTTRKIAWEIARGRDPHTIFAVTFTRRAAAEMRERLHALLARRGGAGGALPWIGTFHSLALALLRETYAGATGFARAGWGAMPKLLGEGEARSFEASFWADRMRRGVEEIPQPKELPLLQAEWGDPERLEAAEPSHPLLPCWRDWTARKRGGGAVEFDDLLAAATTLLERDPDVLACWRGRLGYLLVDEYQDTNRMQYLFGRRLIGGQPDLLAVGDDDQAIYGFRGADVRNILDFRADHPDARMLALVRNYRSNASILRVANALFPDKRQDLRKTLLAGRQGKEGPPAIWWHASDEDGELGRIAALVGRRLSDGTPPESVCILYRSNREEAPLREVLAAYPQSPDGNGAGIRFLTVHAAKGLEWPVVFYAGLDAPERDSVVLLPPDVDEERRIFYVGCTRARDELHLSSCARRRRGGRWVRHRPLPWLGLVRREVTVGPGWLDRLRSRLLRPG